MKSLQNLTFGGTVKGWVSGGSGDNNILDILKKNCRCKMYNKATIITIVDQNTNCPRAQWDDTAMLSIKSI